MMPYLELSWAYFKIGLFTIGGGYAMIPLIRQEIVGRYITEEMFLNMMAIAESTPGPFAVNLATFVGMEVGSASGTLQSYLFALVATIGVTLPSFIIMLLLCALLTRVKDSPVVGGAFGLARPVVLGLIASAALTVLLTVILPNVRLNDLPSSSAQPFNYLSLILFAVFLALSFIKIKGKRVHPILLLVFSALVGLVLFGLIGLG